MVDNLRIQFSYFADGDSPEFKAPYNHLFNLPWVYTSNDKAGQTPNSDTPYSWIGFDLRAEPIVVSVPEIERERYPEWDAMYLNYSGTHDINLGYKATCQIPKNQTFCLITIYGKDGCIKNKNCIFNSFNVKLNSDGTFTVYFGSMELCGDVPNRLDVTAGWNFFMRI